RALAADPACLPLAARLPSPQARDALRTRPVCRRALTDLGASRAQLGDYKGARHWLTLGLAAEPDDGAALLDLARLDRLEKRAR
ncbi:MAG: hypothetical protein KGM24_08675, partial [Elusimicrobia bacterium]|nr:hypothetical protein [Elusimicrobiota bacterium]